MMARAKSGPPSSLSVIASTPAAILSISRRWPMTPVLPMNMPSGGSAILRGAQLGHAVGVPQTLLAGAGVGIAAVHHHRLPTRLRHTARGSHRR